MRSQAEIIVGGEIDYFFAVERADRCLLVLEHAQAEVSAFGLKIIQLIGEVKKRIGAGSLGWHSTASLIPGKDVEGTRCLRVKNSIRSPLRDWCGSGCSLSGAWLQSCRESWRRWLHPLGILRRIGAISELRVWAACLKACPDTNPIIFDHGRVALAGFVRHRSPRRVHKQPPARAGWFE